MRCGAGLARARTLGLRLLGARGQAGDEAANPALAGRALQEGLGARGNLPCHRRRGLRQTRRLGGGRRHVRDKRARAVRRGGVRGRRGCGRRCGRGGGGLCLYLAIEEGLRGGLRSRTRTAASKRRVRASTINPPGGAGQRTMPCCRRCFCSRSRTSTQTRRSNAHGANSAAHLRSGLSPAHSSLRGTPWWRRSRAAVLRIPSRTWQENEDRAHLVW